MPESKSSQMPLPATQVVGRFAPSPTGPLHFGSLVAALGSFLSARSQGGRWLLRIDDLDPPRELNGAADTIQRQLEALALQWDGEVLLQSTRTEAYQVALAALAEGDLLYFCACGRRALKASAPIGIDGLVYPGTCREAGLDDQGRRSQRFRIGVGVHAFDDRIRGVQRCLRAADLGDFILRRSDGLISYPLAAAIDDPAQGITEVVRGADLLAGTHRQIIVQNALALATPNYAHLPMVLDSAGEKLSKSEGAATLNLSDPIAEFLRALAALGQISADDSVEAADFDSPEALLRWATARWDLAKVPSADHRLLG